MFQNTIYDCNIIHFTKIHNRAGNISVIENNLSIPFSAKRVYYLYDVPTGADRGGHAHKNLSQLIIAASGSFDILLDDGKIKKNVYLNRPDMGLLVKPGIWRELSNFSGASICLVLASEIYDENDYIRDYDEFLTFRCTSPQGNK